MDRNKQLQEAYTVHHESVLLAINPESVIGFLFAEKVLSVADNLKLTEVDGDTNKTRQLLAMLHARGHPESFIKLHEAIKRDQSYEWLVEQIDDQCARSQTFSDAANKDSVDRLYHDVLLEHSEAVIKSADPHDILLNHLIICLRSKGCLNETHEQIIRSKIVSRDRVFCLLQILSAEGQKAFQELCNSLESFGTSDKEELANVLRKSFAKKRDDVAPRQAVDQSTATSSTPTLKHCLFSDDDRRVVGVTVIDSRLFVLRGRPSRQQIQVYNAKSFRRQGTLPVAGLINDTTHSGLASCATNDCLYVSGPDKDLVYKVELSANNKVSSWYVDREPRGLSINAACNLLVTCFWARKVKEYSSDTRISLVREISLLSNDIVLYPLLAVQLTTDQFVVSCYNNTKRMHDVIEFDTKGQIIVSYGNQLKSTTQHEFKVPRDMSVDISKELIFVADTENNRIVILDRSLKCCARELNVPPIDGGLQQPNCLSYNALENRLFVGESIGRVLVFDDVI